MNKRPIVIVDDNPRTISKVVRRIEEEHGKDVYIETANSLKEGQHIVRRLKEQGIIPKRIISDLDMGTGLRLDKKWDGYRFAKWCVKEGINPETITLHSTAFERGNIWKPMHRASTLRWAKSLGVRTQGKSTTLGTERPKARKK